MPTTLRGITWEHPRGYDCMVASARRYRELFPKVDIQWEFRSLQAFADAPIDELAAEYDLLVIDHPHIPLAAEIGAFAQLDGVGFDDELNALAEQSVGASHSAYAHGGHQYGLASDAAAQVSVYRPDLLPEPPEDWDAVMALARQGRVLWPAKPIDAFSSLITLTANNGTPPGTNSPAYLDPESAGLALQRMHELASLVPESNLGLNPIQVAEALSTGDQWWYCPLAFGYTNYSRAGFRPNRLAYRDIPAGAAGVAGSLLGGAGIAVSASAGDLHAARAFAFWVSSADAQRGVYFDAGGQPGNADAWGDDRLNEETLGFFRNTRATLDGAYVRPRFAGYIEFQDAVSPWVNQAMRGELSDGDLLSRTNDLAAQLLG
jgi:multiple sugar transport system substrate-binding protein